MLIRRLVAAHGSQCRTYVTESVRRVSVLLDGSVSTFRQEAFTPCLPALLPRQHFKGLSATSKWFHQDVSGVLTLNRSYFSRFGATIVPLEITNDDQFVRIEESLSYFLECVNASNSTFDRRPSRYFSAYVPNARAMRRTKKSNDFFSSTPLKAPTARVYLAQAPINDLPKRLRDDVPTPSLVLEAGKGDVYASSIWLGQAPTYTPLHRDPNPNLFVQLAGTKLVRLCTPDVGRAIFGKVQEAIGASASATMRGEEMMQGMEKSALEHEVWSDATDWSGSIWEAELRGGDGLFIPRGWWHSVKGTGSEMTGSVNWWFR